MLAVRRSGPKRLIRERARVAARGILRRRGGRIHSIEKNSGGRKKSLEKDALSSTTEIVSLVFSTLLASYSRSVSFRAIPSLRVVFKVGKKAQHISKMSNERRNGNTEQEELAHDADTARRASPQRRGEQRLRRPLLQPNQSAREQQRLQRRLQRGSIGRASQRRRTRRRAKERSRNDGNKGKVNKLTAASISVSTKSAGATTAPSTATTAPPAAAACKMKSKSVNYSRTMLKDERERQLEPGQSWQREQLGKQRRE